MKLKTIYAAFTIACMLVVSNAEAKVFKAKNFKGSYSAYLNGTITFLGGNPVFLPTWFIGVISSDGKGNVSVEGKFNFGGCSIVTETAYGTYTVNQNGTGSVSATVNDVAVVPIGTANNPCPSLPPLGGPTSVLKLEFSIVNNKTINAILSSLEDSQGNPIAAFGAYGQANRQ